MRYAKSHDQVSPHRRKETCNKRRASRRIPCCIFLLLLTSVAVTHASAAGATPIADGIVLTQDQLPGYQPDDADSITNNTGSPGLGYILASCAHGDPLLSDVVGGPAAAVGGAFGRGSYGPAIQSGVQSVAIVGASPTAVGNAISIVSQTGFATCVMNGAVASDGSSVQVQSATNSQLSTPTLGDGSSAFDVVQQIASADLSGFLETTVTTIRSGPALALLTTFAWGASRDAARFPDQERLQLAQLLLTRMAAALAPPPTPLPTPPPTPVAAPSLDDCGLSSHTVKYGASVTAASVRLEAGGALTRSQTASPDAPYSVDAESDLKPGLTAALDGKESQLGLEADVSAGLQFTQGLGYEHLTDNKAQTLMRRLETSQGSNAVADNPDSVTSSVGAWLAGDVSGGSATGSASGSASIGLRMDLKDGHEVGDHLLLDLTGTASAAFSSLFGGLTMQTGGSGKLHVVLTLDLTPGDNPTPTGISGKLTTDLLTEDQAKNAVKLSGFKFSANSREQAATETDIVTHVSASDPKVLPAVETLAEAVLADSSGGPDAAAVQYALSVLAAHTTTTLRQSTLTQGKVGLDVKGGEGLAWGISADSTDLDKQLTYSAYTSPGSDVLIPWTACNAAIRSSPPSPATPVAGATATKRFEPWVAVGPGGIPAPAPDLVLTNGGTATCDSGSRDDPGSAFAVRCSPPGNGTPCFVIDTGGGDPNSPLLCSDDPTSKQVTEVTPSGGIPTSYLNKADPSSLPWFLILADGRKCHLLGYGTNTDVLNYDCDNNTGATAPDRSQPKWTVQEGTLQANPTPAPAQVTVLTAYR